jgi:hypothetical protein
MASKKAAFIPASLPTVFSLLRFPVYLLGAYIAVPACFEVWMEVVAPEKMWSVPGFEFFPDYWTIADRGGLVVILLLAIIILLDLFASRLAKSPRTLVVAAAAALTVAAWSVVSAYRQAQSASHPLVYVDISPEVDRILYGSILVLAAAVWGCAFSKIRSRTAASERASNTGSGGWLEDLGFFIQWLVATGAGMTLGISIGMLTSDALTRFVFDLWPEVSASKELFLAREATELMPNALIMGASIGAVQWLVLRERVNRSLKWIGATALGWAAGWSVSWYLVSHRETLPAGLSYPMDWSKAVNPAGIYLVTGLCVGALQFLFLRKRFSRAGWWVLAGAVGTAVAGHVWYVWPNCLFSEGYPHHPGTALVAGLAAGAVTGHVMLALLKNMPRVESARNEHPGEEAAA